MIYNRWGTKLNIVANCGSYATPTGIWSLVKAQPVGDTVFTFYFAETLRADKGLNEIMLAVSSAPRVKLNKKQLETALYIAS